MSDTPEKKQPVDPASEQYREIIRDGLNHMTEAALEINQFVAGRIRKVPESYFLNVLLPIVRAHVRNEYPENLGLWMNVADGMENHIEITDEQGAFLFKLPPPFNPLPNRDQRPEEGRRFGTIAQLVGRQADMLDNGDTRGSMVIDNEIAALCAPRPEDETKTKNLALLVQMYARYKLPLEEVLGAAAAEIQELLDKQEKTGTTAQGSTSNGQETGEEPDLIY